jgi:hypothetical protein
MALTLPRFSSVTIPLRRYQTPSLVRQTSSASILPPLVVMITGLPPCLVPIPGPLVDTGSEVARVCELEIPVAEVFGDGEGDGEGEDEGAAGSDGWAATGCEGTGTATEFEVCVAADVF